MSASIRELYKQGKFPLFRVIHFTKGWVIQKKSLFNRLWEEQGQIFPDELSAVREAVKQARKCKGMFYESYDPNPQGEQS